MQWNNGYDRPLVDFEPQSSRIHPIWRCLFGRHWELPILQIADKKNACPFSLFTHGSIPGETKATILADRERTFWPSFWSGAIKRVIHRAFPITQAEQAHAILQRRENLGKVVLTVKGHGP
jgi:NADPH:quinone reductase-like Zn-dependent oxidoreductase